MKEAVDDPDKIVVFTTSPSVRVALGEEFGMEEANELIRRLGSNNIPIPQLTSCCPAWVKFVETYYPEFKENLSTSKSPIGMQGPTIKTYFANQ